MKIRMAYPDGSIHTITPSRLVRSGGLNGNIYVLDYFDETLWSNMSTILIEENGTFFKQPLREYNRDWQMFYDFSQRRGLLVSLNRLPGFISCKKPEYFDDISRMAYSNKPEKKEPLRVAFAVKQRYIIYHNLNDGEYYWDEACTMIVKGGLESLKGYDYEIIDIRGKVQTIHYISDYITNANQPSDNIQKYYYEGDKKSHQKYLFDRGKSTFYLKEDVAKKFNLIGNKFRIKYNFYGEDGKLKSEEDNLVIIPIFDIIDENIKIELDSNKIEIDDSQIVGKDSPRSIKLYTDKNVGRFLLRSKLLDKYVKDYDIDVSYQYENSNFCENGKAIKYTPELRMKLERIASEHIYFNEFRIYILGTSQRKNSNQKTEIAIDDSENNKRGKVH